MTEPSGDDGTCAFDVSADEYRRAVSESISFSGKDVGYFAQAKADHLVRLADAHLGRASELSVLDVGCGVGTTDTFLAGRFARVSGVDVSSASIEEAASANPTVEYRGYAGDALPYDDESVDLAFAACVLHHIEPADRASFTREMRRVVRPGGLVVVFEHNPINPVTRYAVRRCEFDDGCLLLGAREVRGLFASAELQPVEQSYISLVPSNRPALVKIERALRRAPLGAQYLVCGMR